MATSANDEQYRSSITRYKTLMTLRNAIVVKNGDRIRIDLDITNAFNHEAAKEIDDRLDAVEELTAIRKELTEMQLGSFSVDIPSRIFSVQGYKTYGDDVAKWKELKAIRKEMQDC